MVRKIVLTGGPGSGKTTVLNKIKQIYEQQGIKVIVVSETATDLLNSGISFLDNTISLLDFQEMVLRLQLTKEDIVDRTINYSTKEDILVIYDRGTIDNTAYISKEEFDIILKRVCNDSFSDLLNRYDLVINLVGREDFYTTENNKARSEKVDQALELGKKTLYSWIGHKNLKIVKPKDSIDEKINEVLNIINELLEKNRVKRQEKYSVDLLKSNIDEVLNNSKCACIEQVYLEAEENVEKRLRKIEFNDSISYIFSVYKVINGKKVIIEENVIGKELYSNLLEFRDKKYGIIRKKRYYFTYDGGYFYLDIFNDNKEIGILETNVLENEKVVIPSFISVLENVTNNDSYYNRMIAYKKGKELKKND